MNPERIALGAIAVVAMTLPFAHTTGIRTIALAVAVCALPFAWRRLAVPRIPLLWFFAATAMVGGLSLLWSVDLQHSRRELKTELLYPALLFVATFAVSRDVDALKKLALAAAFATVLSLLGPFFAIVDYKFAERYFLYSGLGVYSTFLVIAYPFALAAALAKAVPPRTRRAFAVAALLMLAGGVLSFSRAFPLIAAIETVLVFTAHRVTQGGARKYRHAAIAGIVAAALIGSVAAVQKERWLRARSLEPDVVASMTGDKRWNLWAYSIARITDNPWKGAGFGRGILRKELPKHSNNSYFWHAHNTVLNWGLQMGVPGMLLLLGLFGSALWRLDRVYRDAEPNLRPYIIAAMVMVLGLCLKNQTDDFFLRQTVLAFWAALGAVLGVASRTAARQRPP